MAEYEVTVVVGRLKTEHVGSALRRLQAAAESLGAEGLDVDVRQSVERDRDGVERWPEWVDSDGSIRDRAHWEVES